MKKVGLFGKMGIVIGFIALTVGFLHIFLGPIDPPKTVENFVQEKAKSIKDALVAGIKGEEVVPEPVRRSHPDQVLQACLLYTSPSPRDS